MADNDCFIYFVQYYSYLWQEDKSNPSHSATDRTRNVSYSSLSPFQLNFYPQDLLFKVISGFYFVNSNLRYKAASNLNNQQHSPLLMALFFLKTPLFFSLGFQESHCFLVFLLPHWQLLFSLLCWFLLIVFASKCWKNSELTVRSLLCSSCNLLG